ncbi:MAG: hypothetical protein R2795_12465 [Saprospiraceae bacterium]
MQQPVDARVQKIVGDGIKINCSIFANRLKKIEQFISVKLLGDGLKITAPVFDSLKFFKQATKRSLRENIRESVEKMGVVISVFSLGGQCRVR